MYFLYLLLRANAFSVDFHKKVSNIALVCNHFSKPDWRGSYRDHANGAKAYANDVLQVVSGSKKKSKMCFFLLKLQWHRVLAEHNPAKHQSCPSHLPSCRYQLSFIAPSLPS